MRILIAEDDYVSRKFMFKFLSKFGECDVTVDGMEAIEVFLMALEEKNYYDLVCLDIMMPEVDGIKALKTIRKLEQERNLPKAFKTKVVMTTALNNTDKVMTSFSSGSEAYAVKPIDTQKLTEVLQKLGFEIS
ncbi:MULTISPECIES: response regulator [unclassified Fusibacter]|uniref:response regulator n=1 Tax=unclassified Fusibacter TaxID=2624464 RepID=UPI0010119B2D|nr:MULTISPECIES: response regulator [unclassified Fusibacter]MCK8061384.1 response regulator [Fusibacter sp. A2]NPE23573.1 response regulator [Fusibacter sp. A1]RXV58983.1 response regulator [Fusibacter sp. A1]